MAVGDALAQPGVLFQAMHIVVIRTVDVLVTQLQVERRHAIGQYRLQTWCQPGDNDVRRDRVGIEQAERAGRRAMFDQAGDGVEAQGYFVCRSEEHTSELQSLMRISYAVFGLKTKKI